MSYSPPPSLNTFAPLTVISSNDVNVNFATLRNLLVSLVPSANTLSADTLTEQTVGAGITVNKKFAVSGGIATFASGIAITGGVVSGIATFSSGFAISGGVVSGVATFSSGLAISAGVVSGAATFSSGVSVTAGTLTAPVGSSVSLARVSQVVYQNTAQLNTSSTVPVTMASYIAPANALANDGDRFRIGIAGTVGALTTGALVVNFGATSLLNVAVSINQSYYATIVVMRSTSNAQLARAFYATDTPRTVIAQAVPGETLSGPVEIDVIGSVATAGGTLRIDNMTIEVLAV